MVLKTFSYAMIGTFIGGLAATIVGSATVILNLYS
jgi:hypothetical protein